MSAADVIEEAIQGTLHEDMDVYIPECMWVAEAVLAALSAAGYVVATPEEIRAWPVEQVAELIGGEVLKRPFKSNLDERGYVWCEAVHGPWVEVRDDV